MYLSLSALGDLKNELNLESFNLKACKESIITKNTAMRHLSLPTSELYKNLARDAKAVMKANIAIDQEWYIFWQIIRVIHIFMTKCAPLLIPDLNVLEATYSLEELCKRLNFDFGSAQLLILQKLQEPKYQTNESKTKNSKKIARKRRFEKTCGNIKKGAQQIRVKKELFDTIIWTCLQSVGWSMERGKRETDKYYFPGGVTRGSGFKCRVDFFDSRLQIYRYLTSNPKNKWSLMNSVSEALKQYQQMAASK